MQTHAKVEAGEPLLPDVLCGIHAQLNRDYYGPQLVVDDTLSYEWARIPHFYRHFYVYQYATGISAAIAIANRILSGVPGAVEDYKKFLSGGSSQHPIELLRLAGGGYGLAPAGAGHRRGVLRDPRRAEKAALIPPAGAPVRFGTAGENALCRAAFPAGETV